MLILPYLGEEKLYKEFHLDEPWDSDHNKMLIPRMPKVFVVPGLPGSDTGLTRLPGSRWRPMPCGRNTRPR